MKCSQQWASWEDLQTRHPYWLIGGPPDGVCDTASTTSSFFDTFFSEPCLLFFKPLTGSPAIQFMTQSFNWGKREMGLFGSTP